MRITFVRDLGFANSNYRSFFPAIEMSRRYDVAINLAGDPRFSMARLMKSDVVHIHRFADDEMYGVMRHLRSKGIGVIWDDDDDLSAIPKESPLYKSRGGINGARALQRIRQVARLVNAVTTPSPVLARKFEAVGAANVAVLENFICLRPSSRRPSSSDGVTLGWIAGLEHHYDVQHLRLQPVFERLLEQHPTLRIRSVGLSLGLTSDRYTHTPRLQFEELPGEISKFDIGIAPLADSPFNRARSNIKVKEYAACGTPWLASQAVAYAGLGEREGGRLVGDDDWFAALDVLIRDRKARKRLASRAAKYADTQMLAVHAHEWERVFRSTFAAIEAERGNGQQSYGNAPVPT